MLKRMRNDDRFDQAQEKDLAKLDSIIKNNEADDRRLAKILKKKYKERQDEINRQTQEGIVSKPKVIGRFKYK